MYDTIVKFAEIRKLDRLSIVRDFDLFPDTKNLLNFERKYGDSITYEDINGVKKRRRKRAKKGGDADVGEGVTNDN
jgi:hypothetical protein